MSLAIEDLSAGYGNEVVLHEINLSVAQVHMRSSWAGTARARPRFLRCVNAILKPRQGRVTAMGQMVTRLPRREIARLISLVPQTRSRPCLLPALK